MIASTFCNNQKNKNKNMRLKFDDCFENNNNNDNNLLLFLKNQQQQQQSNKVYRTKKCEQQNIAKKKLSLMNTITNSENNYRLKYYRHMNYWSSNKKFWITYENPIFHDVSSYNIFFELMKCLIRNSKYNSGLNGVLRYISDLHGNLKVEQVTKSRSQFLCANEQFLLAADSGRSS
ncbi:unnamed protein product [Didymodactylos carnosus]|uniref:Uncharacterized protein n=1 Tax=Didymodactylos carnosus TaxID=1234261 RepID=A0A8S2FFK1_9BILA|nr:unnamed protein product [Didymodactylos carnosus]CAF4243702.1 unnamed protein product [Didymodactylos carnosus]